MQLKKCFIYIEIAMKKACHTSSMQTQLASEVKNPIASKCNQQLLTHSVNTKWDKKGL